MHKFPKASIRGAYYPHTATDFDPSPLGRSNLRGVGGGTAEFFRLAYGAMKLSFVFSKYLDTYSEYDIKLTVQGHYTHKITTEIKIMAKTKKLGDWKGFADINLSKAQKAQAKKWIEDEAQVLDTAEDMLASGYKITLSYDSRSDAHMCSISCYNETSDNYKHTMVTRAKTMFSALGVGVFKHHVVAQGEWNTGDDIEIDF